MTHFFDDIVLDVNGCEYAYRGHGLYAGDAAHTGFATAAMVAVWLVGTKEGEQRGIGSLKTAEERLRLMEQYEEETIREDGGILMLEVEQLHWWLWHVSEQSSDENETPAATKRAESYEDENILMMSQRQWVLWLTLIREYMTRLVDRWAAMALAAEDNVNESENYMEWLLGQLGVYSRIQEVRKVDWCNQYQVEEFLALQSRPDNSILANIHLSDIITHLPADVDEKQVMDRYYTLRKAEHAARRVPPTGAEWYEKEKEGLSEEEVLGYIDEFGRKELADNQKRWLRWLSKKVKVVTPTNVPLIWNMEFVDERLEKKLTEHLLAQEEDEDEWCKQLTAALFAMKLDHYIREDLTAPEFRKWAAVYLKKDYKTPSIRVQLDRKWDKWERLDTPVQQQLHFIRNYR